MSQRVKERFAEHVTKAILISSIIPYYILNETHGDLAPAGSLYHKFLPGSVHLSLLGIDSPNNDNQLFFDHNNDASFRN